MHHVLIHYFLLICSAGSSAEHLSTPPSSLPALPSPASSQFRKLPERSMSDIRPAGPVYYSTCDEEDEDDRAGPSTTQRATRRMKTTEQTLAGWEVCTRCDGEATGQLWDRARSWVSCVQAAAQFWSVRDADKVHDAPWHYAEESDEINEACEELECPGLVSYSVLRRGLVEAEEVLYLRSGCLGCCMPSFRRLLLPHVRLGAAVFGIKVHEEDLCSAGLEILIGDAVAYWKEAQGDGGVCGGAA